MNATCNRHNQKAHQDLLQIIEPLASYISAANQPRETLLSALTALFDEVKGTHKATLMHIASHQVDSIGLAL